MSLQVAEFLLVQAMDEVAAKGFFTLALSGGRSPRLMFERLCREPYISQLPWANIHLFWTDERAVPPDHPDSNYGMAWTSFLSKVPIAPTQIHRMPADQESLDDAAILYEQMIRQFVQPAKNGIPAFDLILLGVGDDGHTASLFPGDDLLEEKDRLIMVASGVQGKPPVSRLTMTLPLINQARVVAFMVSGENKEPVVRKSILDPVRAPKLYPAARVCARQLTLWFIDHPFL